MSKNILIIALTDLSKSPRPIRQIKSLKDKFRVDTMGLAKSGLENNFYKINKKSILSRFVRLPLLLLKMYNLYYWDREKKTTALRMNSKEYDLIIVHEVRMLPFAFEISKNAKIILDAHEYSPNNFDDNLMWKIFIKPFYIHLCNKYLIKCDKVITVCDKIAELYQQNFNIRCQVVTNASNYYNYKPYDAKGDKVRIIHHGIASSSRKLELMITMMDYLDDRFELHLMLVAKRMNKIYFSKLQKMAKNYKNIYFLDPVPYDNIVEFSNKFDVGLIFFPPSNLNLKYCLPNKFFEFLQSRLCIATSPLEEIEKYVKKYDLGVVSRTFDPFEMAQSLNKLSKSDIMKYKIQCDKNAYKLSSITNQKKILNIVDSLI